MPLFLSTVEPTRQSRIKFSPLDRTFRVFQRRPRIKFEDPPAVSRNQPFFALTDLKRLNNNCTSELSLSLLIPISSDAAATTTQNAGDDKI